MRKSYANFNLHCFQFPEGIRHILLFASSSTAGYNRRMDAIMQVLGSVLEWMFFMGMAGSALVVVISFIEDFNTIFEED